MSHGTQFYLALILLCMSPALACESSDGAAAEGEDASIAASDVADAGAEGLEEDAHSAPIEGLGHTFTHKMMKATDENTFSSLAYECPECSVAQQEAIVAPEGWSKGPVQIVLPMTELRSRPSFAGVADAMDFVPEMPGEEYLLIAKVLDGELIEVGAGGVIVRTQVMRDTVLRFPAQSRIHELTSPEGDVFVLFAHEIDAEHQSSLDFQSSDALDTLVPPADWTYTSRLLDEELTLDTPDIATVLAIRTEQTSSWQKR